MMDLGLLDIGTLAPMLKELSLLCMAGVQTGQEISALYLISGTVTTAAFCMLNKEDRETATEIIWDSGFLKGTTALTG